MKIALEREWPSPSISFVVIVRLLPLEIVIKLLLLTLLAHTFLGGGWASIAALQKDTL